MSVPGERSRSRILHPAKSQLSNEHVRQLLHRVQFDLFIVSFEVAVFPRDVERLEYRVDAARVEWLESQIDALEEELQLQECCFVVPGESQTSALLDVCRSIARRAERQVVALRMKRTVLNERAPVYLNRLSDLLYLLARAQEPKHQKFVAQR